MVYEEAIKACRIIRAPGDIAGELETNGCNLILRYINLKKILKNTMNFSRHPDCRYYRSDKISR